jgi:hypothetical protein
MISFNKEYFRNNCYFYLKDKGETFSLYYSVADTLVESRKKDEKKDFPKNKLKKVESLIKKYFTSKSKPSKKEVDKDLENVGKSEIDELIDSDGTMLSSRVPFLNMYLHPKKTMDQTVVASRISNDPVTRGYRVYWGESEDEKDNVVSEIDYSDAFGYEETEYKDFNDTVKTLKNMGVDNAVERAKQFGKLPKQKRTKGKLKQRLVEKGSIEEEEKKMMSKMVEDILAKKSKDSSDVVSKNDDAVSKILMRNLKSIKKIAEKEGVSINKLINILKSDE